MADGVDAAMDRVQAARRDAVRDAVAAHAGGKQLRPGDESMLPLCQLRDGPIRRLNVTLAAGWAASVTRCRSHPLNVTLVDR